jgi:pimeloyl-ACP methyl ester carboxylesterase
MQFAAPHFREAGQGDAVICLHANSSSSSQYRALMELLAPRYHVLTPDFLGHGKSPDYPRETRVSLAEEAAFLEPVFARARTPFVLVGHSYGAAVALIATLRDPQRVRALALYEPTLFSLVDGDRPPPNDADGIRQTVADAVAALEAGDPQGAAARFIDYWMGTGAWNAMPAQRREPIAASIVHIESWAAALMTEPTPLATFASLDLPVLLMVGRQSPPSSRAVARLLEGVLPWVQEVELDGLGHMGPVTHPEVVNRAIVGFLEFDRTRP